MLNKKIFVFLSMSIILLIGLSTINATDSNDNTIDDSISNPINNYDNDMTTHTVTQDNNHTNNYNTTDTSEITSKDIQKQQKNIKKAKTIIITNETFDTYFTDKYLNDNVSPGDTLDFQGNFLGEHYSMYINKAVNITSTTNDSYICLNTSANDWFGGDDVAAFTINKDGAYTNVSNIYFFNTQIFVKNSNHIIFNNISAIVDSRPVGRGVGQTSIRDNSSFVTVENCTFSTKDQWADCGLVLAWANNCTVRYNEIYGYGQVGNLFYLTTFNVDNLPYDSEGHIDYSIVNVNNTFENNYLEADTVDGMNYAICLCGSNNRIINNTVKYDGACINIQAYMHGYDMNTTIINNTAIGGNFISPNGSVIINNTVTSGYFAPGANCILENNNVANIRLFYDNYLITKHTVNNIEISGHKENITIENCTINNNLTVKGTSSSDTPVNITLKNNHIRGYVLLNGSTNLTLTNNTIGQQVIIAGRNNFNKNLSITDNNITTDKQYTVIVNTTVNALNISDNLLLTNDAIGNVTIYFKSIRDSYIAENNEYIIGSNKLTDANYLKFFNEDSTAKSNAITNNMILELASNIYNKDFTFTDTNITFANPDNYTIYNSTVNATNDANVIMEGLIIDNRNKENTIILESANNQIKNTKMDIDSEIDQKTILVTGDNNTISYVTIDSTATSNSTLILADNISNLNITNSQLKSDNGYGINITSSQNILIDNNHMNITCDNTVNVKDSTNINVTNNQLFAEESVGDQSVNTSNSTCTIQNNNQNRNIVTITGNLTVYMPSNITIKITDSLGNPNDDIRANATINNNKTSLILENGIATITYTPSSMDDVKVTVIQANSYTSSKTTNMTLKVSQIATNTTLTSVKGLIGQKLTLNATVKDVNNNNVKDGVVTFTYNTGKTLATVKVTNGVASTTVSYNTIGNYTITATYTNGSIYKTSTAKATATIGKVNLAITGSPTALTPSNITIQVTDENNKAVTTGSVTIKINNLAQTVSFKNGIATVSYTTQNTNKLNVTATYTTTDKYTVNKTSTLSVAQINTKTTITSAKGLVGQTLTVNATVKDANNNNVKDGTITFTDNTGKTLATVKVTNGIASTNVSYNAAGNYTITATYTNSSIYKTSTAKSTVTIGKVNLAITGSLTALTKGDITVKVTDENNKAVTTGSVAVKVNNVAQTVSFKNGVATISYTPQNTNKLNVAATYTAADKFAVNKTATLQVAKISTKLTITSNNTKPRVNDKVKLTITLKDNNNKTVANKNVTVTVNNKNYTITTDKTGLATVNYTMNKNYANLTANANFKGDNTYKESTKTLTLNRTFTTEVKLLTGSFDAKPGDTVKLIAHITDNGLDINGGQLVFKIDGKTLTDASGNAVKVNIKDGFAILEYKIPDTLSAGTRNLSATFSSGKYSGRLSTPMLINKLVTHIDVNPLYTTGNQIQVKAQVVDQNNQALNKQTAICIKFNGKSYNFNTTTGTINYQINQTLKDGYYNLTIIAGANGKYQSSTVNTVVIKTKTAIKTNYINNTLNNKSTANSGDIKTGKYMSLLTGASTVKPGDTLKLIAHVTTGGIDITGGQLGFKIDGLTLNDSKNNKVFRPKDGLAILEYKVPDTLSAGTRNLSTVYSSKTYGDERLNSTLTMNKLNTHIEAQPTYTTSSTPTIQATILDDNNELINKQTKVVIKIDGKSYSINNDNGKISYKVPSNLSKGLHQITIIAGENGKYLSSRANTVIIKT